MNGDHGADSGDQWTGGFNNAGDDGSGEITPDHFPVEANVRIKTKTFAGGNG